MRALTLTLVLALASCAGSSKADPPPDPSHNFVCDRWSRVNPKAVCKPEYTNIGEHHTHSASITVDKAVVACMINDSTVSVVCDEPVVIMQSEQKAAAAAQKSEPPKTEAKGK
jgi:hypothetical protein